MSYTANTLQSIINESFDGKKSHLATTCGIAPRVITMLTKDQRFTPDTFSQISAHLSEDDSQRLALAAARDLLPEHLATDLSFSPRHDGLLHEPSTSYNQADPYSEKILKMLRALVARDKEAREWLHTTAEWIFPHISRED